MNNYGYENFKRILVFVMGVAVLITSLYFSKTGFEFKVMDGDKIAWVGWVLAVSVTAAQFMFNTRSKDLDWTIILLGLVAYGYSIWSNIQGFYALRGTPSVWDWMNISGGIFMDVFPEKAIAWSLGVIKAGDLIGNIVNVINNPENVTKESKQKEYPPSIPKRDTVSKPDVPQFLANRNYAPQNPPLIRKHNNG